MMAMAQLLNIGMPGSYELTFPPQNPELPGGDGPGKTLQSGVHSEFVPLFILIRTIRHRHWETYSKTRLCSNYVYILSK